MTTERRALVAEDSLLILIALEMLLDLNNVQIVGPASTLAETLALAETGGFEIAILDVNLHGEMIFPVAELLKQRRIPFVFTTGYAPDSVIPPRFRSTPSIQKPYQASALMVLIEQAFALAGAQQPSFRLPDA